MGLHRSNKRKLGANNYLRPEERSISPKTFTEESEIMLIDNAPALLRAAADVMVIPVEAITGKRKTQAEALARQIVMTLWAESHSLQSACEIVGRHHHTTAVYARQKIHERLGYCEATRQRLAKVLKKYSEIILADEQGEP
jgi:chromosomal replication initiation ATPase DnaA